MPRSSRRNSRTLARPSRSSDLACASRRRVPGRVSIRSRLTGTTDCLRAGRTLLAGAFDRRNATPAEPLSPCVLASYPDAGVIRNVALGVSRRAAENSDRRRRTSLSLNPIDRNPVHVPFASFRIAGRDFNQGRPPARAGDRGAIGIVHSASDHPGFPPPGSGPAARSFRNVSGDVENGYQTGARSLTST